MKESSHIAGLNWLPYARVGGYLDVVSAFEDNFPTEKFTEESYAKAVGFLVRASRIRRISSRHIASLALATAIEMLQEVPQSE